MNKTLNDVSNQKFSTSLRASIFFVAVVVGGLAFGRTVNAGTVSKLERTTVYDDGDTVWLIRDGSYLESSRASTRQMLAVNGLSVVTTLADDAAVEAAEQCVKISELNHKFKTYNLAITMPHHKAMVVNGDADRMKEFCNTPGGPKVSKNQRTIIKDKQLPVLPE